MLKTYSQDFAATQSKNPQKSNSKETKQHTDQNKKTLSYGIHMAWSTTGKS